MSHRGRLPFDNRRGATLIDVAVGSMLLAVVLIPSLQLMRENETLFRQRALSELALYECEQLLAQRKIWLQRRNGAATNFDVVLVNGSDQESGLITPADSPPLRGETVVTRDSSLSAATGLTVEIVRIDATVWRDANNNQRVDADEAVERLSTFWAPR